MEVYIYLATTDEILHPPEHRFKYKPTGLQPTFLVYGRRGEYADYQIVERRTGNPVGYLTLTNPRDSFLVIEKIIQTLPDQPEVVWVSLIRSTIDVHIYKHVGDGKLKLFASSGGDPKTYLSVEIIPDYFLEQIFKPYEDVVYVLYDSSWEWVTQMRGNNGLSVRDNLTIIAHKMQVGQNDHDIIVIFDYATIDSE